MKKTILIVDDSLMIIERVESMLKELDATRSVRHALDYMETIKVLEEEQPDIIFLDIQLPGKNGIELLKFIKINYPEIFVIMLSNESGDYYRKLCKAAGASYFIDKSREFDKIPEVLSFFG